MNPNLRITLDQWAALVAVVDAGGYAQAAERLHKSQSSISYAVQQIASQLEVELFVLEGRKAVLTPAGKLLYRRARDLLDDAAAIETASRTLSAGWETEVRLAVEVIFPPWLLLECLARFGEERPQTRIEVHELVLGHTTDALATGAVDLAIFGHPPAGFMGDVLMRMRFLPVAHPSHRLHQLGRALTPRDLRQHRHLVVRESNPDRPTAPSVSSTRRWTFTHISTSIEAARAGYGYAWLPEELIRAELDAGTLRPLPMRDGNERFADLYLLFANREHAGPATLRLAELIRDGVTRRCRQAAAVALPAAPERASHRARKLLG